MEIYKFSFSSMGCPCYLQVYAPNKKSADDLFKEIFSELKKLDHFYTNYSEDSFTAEINRSAGNKKGIQVDVQTAYLLDYAEHCYRVSNGLFDLTVGALRRIWHFNKTSTKIPIQEKINKTLALVGWDKISWKNPHLILPKQGMVLDFGGIVKEYAVDCAAKKCRQLGFNHALINMGGDIAAVGPHLDGQPWRIGIQHPRCSEGESGQLLLSQGAVATSGDYERSIIVKGVRYSHILNPLTGWPATGISSVTVVGDHCIVAGSLSTIAFIKGPSEGVQWLNNLQVSHLCFDDVGNQILQPDESSSVSTV